MVEAHYKAVLDDKYVERTTVINTLHASKVTSNIVSIRNSVVKTRYNSVVENTTGKKAIVTDTLFAVEVTKGIL